MADYEIRAAIEKVASAIESLAKAQVIAARINANTEAMKMGISNERHRPYPHPMDVPTP